MTEPDAELVRGELGGCRWVEGEPTPIRTGMFCGEPTAPGGSWCPRHRKLVWAYRRGAAVRRPEAPKPSLH
jgi:hypothetical protein